MRRLRTARSAPPGCRPAPAALPRRWSTGDTRRAEGDRTEMHGSSTQRLDYPAARKDAIVDDYHGTAVADPYRWLEDPDAPDTVAWVEAENRLTRAFLDAVP